MEILLGLLDLIDEIICIPLAWFVSKLPISILKQLEIGVYFFCKRQAQLAEKEGLFIAELLEEQAQAEYRHAQTLAMFEGTYLVTEDKLVTNWGIAWGGDSSIRGDGMSRNYLSARVFFLGIKASDFDWEDKLAFMCILEKFQSVFYWRFIRHVPLDCRYYFNYILEDEIKHSSILENILVESQGNKNKLLIWHLRKYLALLFLPIDLIREYAKK